MNEHNGNEYNKGIILLILIIFMIFIQLFSKIGITGFPAISVYICIYIDFFH